MIDASTRNDQMLGGALVLAIVAFSSLGNAALVTNAATPVIPDDVKDHVSKRVGQDAPYGIVIGMVGEGGTTFHSYGRASKDGPALDPDNIFEIGSITKVFTAMLLADAVARGEVKLDDPVAKHLPPTVKVPAKGDKAITLEHLASHRSGLPRMPDNFEPKDEANPYADYTPQRLYEFLGHAELENEPGAASAYSNLGAGLLGHTLCLKTGMSYDDLVRRRLCEPLGMKHTACAFTPDMKKRLAQGHAGGKAASNWDLDALAGAGALRSSAKDMTTFLSACLGLSGDQIRPLIARCLASRFPTESTDTEIALGWHVNKKYGTDIVWHNGGTGGYHSFCGFRADQKLGVVVLANSDDNIDEIGMRLLASAAPLSTPRATAKLDPAKLSEYLGHYEFTPGMRIEIARDGDGLTAQMTGQSALPIFPEAADKFFLKVVDAQLSFVRGEDGKVAKLILHQNGIDQTAKKLPPGEEPKARVEVKVSPEILKSYVGKYQLAPGVMFDVRLDGEKLMVQLTGQQRFPVFPESETKFFYKVVDAQLTFVKGDDGKVTSLILHQGGRDQIAKRIEE